jgi:hypothetical protein
MRMGVLIVLAAVMALGGGTAMADVTKQKDIIVYQDETFYSAFPSIVRRQDGELIVAFRRAPDRRVFGEKGSNHTDPNSYLVLVRSEDNGETWTKKPELIHAHPFGGSQDPCMVQLNDGTIVCSSYAWARVKDDVKENFPEAIRHDNFVFMGGYLVRSEDGGHTWGDMILPPPVRANVSKSVFDRPIPAYNRGAMVEGKDGRLYWAVAVHAELNPRRTEVHLMISEDGGLTWEYSCPIAQDEKASFNEASMYETPEGDLVVFLRTANFEDHTVVARSTDGGKSFEPWIDTGWQGHPHYALRLPDDRVFLIYGYRHKPHGIRARILNAECSDVKTAQEIVLRDDGTNGDLGYPWATMTDDGRILAVYYFHDKSGNRHIAGTYLTVD